MKYLLFLMTILLLFISCGSETPQGKTAAEVLYKEANELMADKHYNLAMEKLNTLKSQYPYSFYAKHAQLKQADISFLQENYVEAAAGYILFKDLHPKDEQIPYVLWRTAESYFNQLPSTFDRDLDPANEAIKYYTELTSRFPNYEKNFEALKRIQECNDMIENKEKYIADYYYKTDAYESAKFRYLGIINNFKEKDLVNHARVRVVLSALNSENFDECIKYAGEYSDKVDEKGQKEINEAKNECLKNRKKE
ncbi:MAG: outer membrane protein assembly factor BamD [Bacteriovoracaceae bacterium]